MILMFYLFLDDVRDPPDGTWVVCRTYQQAVDFVDKYGIPHRVSFDHDLGGEKSGFDFAKYLVERDLDIHAMPMDFDYQVHSANPVGRDNIRGLLDRYLAWRNGS